MISSSPETPATISETSEHSSGPDHPKSMKEQNHHEQENVKSQKEENGKEKEKNEKEKEHGNPLFSLATKRYDKPKEMDVWEDGTTAVDVVVTSEALYVANVGDSEMVLAERILGFSDPSFLLYKDHKEPNKDKNCSGANVFENDGHEPKNGDQSSSEVLFHQDDCESTSSDSDTDSEIFDSDDPSPIGIDDFVEKENDEDLKNEETEEQEKEEKDKMGEKGSKNEKEKKGKKGKKGKKEKMRARVLTKLHKPHRNINAEELDRVRQAGGTVIGGRVQGLLAVSRALGDRLLKPPVARGTFVSYRPDLLKVPLDPALHPFAIMACDGLWDVMNYQQAVDRVAKIVLEPFRHRPDFFGYRHRHHHQRHQKQHAQDQHDDERPKTKKSSAELAQLAAKDLVKRALHLGSGDNITVIVLLFSFFS